MRNLTLDATAALGWGAAVGVVNGLLPSLARLGGADPLGLAALGAAPFMANVFALFAGYLGLGDPRRAAMLRAVGCSLLLLAPLVPPSWLVLVVTGFWAGAAVTTPVLHHIWGLIYPPRARARLVSVVRSAQALATAAAALFGGLAADRFGGNPVIQVAGAIGAAGALAYGGISAPAQETAPRFSGLDSLRTLFGNPVLRWVAIGQIVWGAGVFAAQPLYPLVQVDRLHLSLVEIGTLAIVTSAATILSFVPWGVLCDRRGGIPVMAIGCLLGLGAPIAYAVAADLSVLWLAAAGTGLANAAIEIGYTAVLSGHVDHEVRATSAAGWTTVTGIRGTIAPFVAGWLVQAGLLTPTGALVGSAGVAAVALGAYLPAYRAARAVASIRPRPR